MYNYEGHFYTVKRVLVLKPTLKVPHIRSFKKITEILLKLATLHKLNVFCKSSYIVKMFEKKWQKKW